MSDCDIYIGGNPFEIPGPVNIVFDDENYGVVVIDTNPDLDESEKA